MEQNISIKAPKDSLLIIDFSFLKQVSRGDCHFIIEMIQIFLKEIPIALKELEKYCNQGEWLGAANVSHRIKTNYMMMGMKIQEEDALYIEQSIKKENFQPQVIKKLNQKLKNASLLAYPILKKELTQLQKTL